MKQGDVVLTPVPQADERIKTRPALFLRTMPPYGDALVCGISTQLQQQVASFDEIIASDSDDYAQSGLIADSLIRLGFLAVVPQNKLIGSIGTVSPGRHRRLLEKLSNHLLAFSRDTR